MGLTLSQMLFGFHTFLEVGVGSVIFATGIVPTSADPIAAEKTTGNDKLWKRFHAVGLLSMAYIGAVGLAPNDESSKTLALEVCGLFHSLAMLVPMLALNDGIGSLKEATIFNVHLYVALGFGAVRFGYAT
jgi:hypothetical protein